MAVEKGDLVPEFEMPTDDGIAVSSSALRGKPFVMYFYPKDDTSGCTKEALGFSERLEVFHRVGVEVIGVSKDSVVSHEKFRNKHKLSIKLAADEDGKVTEAFGCWVKKNMYGREYMSIDRATFLVGADGRIVQAWRKVKVPGHVDEVLRAAQAISQPSAASP